VKSAPGKAPRNLSEVITFNDRSLASKWSGKPVPMSDLYEAYIDSKIDIPADKWDAFFDARHDLVSFKLTPGHFKWAATNFFPEALIHSKSQDSRIVGEHYNRGNDFFDWCLGEAMVYTAAWYETPETTLEQAQYKKIDRCCEKMNLKKGETLLDIGCGWGTFVARAAREFGAKTLGVTLAQEQVDFGTDRIKKYGVEELAKVKVCDYRNVTGKFDKIVSLEMVEHVGIKNLDTYFKKVHSLLEEDGTFVLQWTGIRGLNNPQNPFQALSLRPEDLIWALFMARYIFPGADASLPLSGMLRAAEDAGFEIQDVENMSSHYIRTLRAWRDHWVSNKEAVVKAYGERWYRLWYFFLHWSALIGNQGTGFTYQVTMHKNHEKFNRTVPLRKV
jgi:cyclopropane fatty-acyl-phospholipid synthase-like methyltransferase